MRNYFKRLGIALSVLFNVLLGGPSNQSFSARNYGWKKEGRANLVFLIDFIAEKVFNDTDHCMSAWIYWYTRKNLEEKKLQ